jgi:[NiFe] hydrogenase assembly HybE family chaperone
MKIISDPQQAAEAIAQAFEYILNENMRDVPILNHRLQVQTLGFQRLDNRLIGIVITPWLMNLIMLPNKEDDWDILELGKKKPITILGRSYKFMVNEIEGIGKCKTHALYSPMHEFNSQNHAIKTAMDFLNDLMTERKPTVEELVDEDLLGQIMRGEEVKVDLEQFAIIESQAIAESEPAPTLKEKLSQPISRRDLLRGKLLTE